MTNKKNKKLKDKKQREIRTKEERQDEVREIIKQLNDLSLNMTYEPIKKLMKLLNTYVNEGVRMKISIPFPEANRTIRGLLATSKNESVYVKLDYEKY